MAIIFLVLLIAVLFAWKGKRYWAISTFAVAYVLAVAIFFYHVGLTIKLPL